MTRLRWLPLAVLLCLPLFAADDKAKTTIGTIERLDPAFDDLIPSDAKLTKLAGDFAWTEGPVWVKKGGFLLFSDIPNNRVMKWQEGKKVETFLQPSGYLGKRTDLKEPGSNALLLDPDGRLILMEHGNHAVGRLTLGQKLADQEVLADKYMGKALNSPNDGVFAKNGDLIFTDPPYGRMLKSRGIGFYPGRELDFCGIYRLSKDGKLTLLTKEMSYPNGIALSPDNRTLYVANSDPDKAVWMSFPVRKDGSLGKGKVFFDSTEFIKMKKKGLPDGMKVDVKGNIFATGPGGVLVFTPEGKHLGTIATGVNTGNCCFGGKDGSTLFVMCDHDIACIRTKTKGLGF
jgi:gluconolactonase